MRLALLDSITDATPDDRGAVGVSGSHGGLYAAACATRADLVAAVFNDAGGGLDNAGVAGVAALDQVGMAGMAVSHNSAEIGSAHDTLECGVISFVNETARAVGLKTGVRLAEQTRLLQNVPKPKARLKGAGEVRAEKTLATGQQVLCVDSAALITPEDEGRIILTGSHGGLIDGDPARACKAQAGSVVFNDAGGGKNGVGFSRLPALDLREVPAAMVDRRSARIGDAISTLQTGVLSAVNEAAFDLGFRPEKPLLRQLERLAARVAQP